MAATASTVGLIQSHEPQPAALQSAINLALTHDDINNRIIPVIDQALKDEDTLLEKQLAAWKIVDIISVVAGVFVVAGVIALVAGGIFALAGAGEMACGICLAVLGTAFLVNIIAYATIYGIASHYSLNFTQERREEGHERRQSQLNSIKGKVNACLENKTHSAYSRELKKALPVEGTLTMQDIYTAHYAVSRMDLDPAGTARRRMLELECQEAQIKAQRNELQKQIAAGSV